MPARRKVDRKKPKKAAKAEKKKTATVVPKTKKVAKPRRTAAVKVKAKAKAPAKAKTKTKTKTTRAAAPKEAARKAAPAPKTPKKKAAAVEAARPSERAMAVAAQVPRERPLTDEERDAMANVSLAAKRFLGVDGTPTEVISRLSAFLDDVRGGRRPEPKSNDVRLGLGVLWGDQVRAQVGWRWVHLTYPELDFSSYALVPDDRAFACFPLNRIPDLMRGGPNTAGLLFDKIRVGELPPRRTGAYLVIG